MPDWILPPFHKLDQHNPLLGPGEAEFDCPWLGRTKWEDLGIFNPSVITRGGRLYCIYRAAGSRGFTTGISRLGLAWSDDGIHFTRHPEPILYPEKGRWKDLEFGTGLQDPRIVEREDGTYVLTYAMFDLTNCYLAVATSRDLMHWEKHGLAFIQARGGKFHQFWTKSGAIVCRREGERMVAARINGKYWMYWGESEIFAATSEDLIHWIPVEMEVEYKKRTRLEDGIWRDNWEHGRQVLRPVLAPRRGRFDTFLVEPGPQALLTEQGILMIYNGCNDHTNGNTSLPMGAYSAGQVLFDPCDPTAVLMRCETPFLFPDRPYELSGTINNVTFASGLAYFKSRWWLYYGCADRYLAACCTPTCEETL